jgi:hypothetical protein
MHVHVYSSQMRGKRRAHDWTKEQLGAATPLRRYLGTEFCFSFPILPLFPLLFKLHSAH